MLKAIGYIIAVIGLVGLALTIESVKKALSLQLPAQLNNITLTIASIALLILGIFLAMKSSSNSISSKDAEVPIYQGNQIVGYRRV